MVYILINRFDSVFCVLNFYIKYTLYKNISNIENIKNKTLKKEEFKQIMLNIKI